MLKYSGQVFLLGRTTVFKSLFFNQENLQHGDWENETEISSGNRSTGKTTGNSMELN